MTYRVKKSIDKNFHEAPEIKQKKLIAQLVMSEFNAFYERYKEITESAKEAFENCDFQESLQISQKRLSLYSVSMYTLGDKITKNYPDVSKDQEFWDGVEDNFRKFVKNIYEADLEGQFSEENGHQLTIHLEYQVTQKQFLTVSFW